MARRLATAAGLLAVAVGVLAVVDHGVAAAVPLSSAVVGLVGLLALVAGLAAAQRWRSAERSTPEVPTPETTTDHPVPGADLDEQIAAIDADYMGTVQERRAVKRRLTALVIAVLTDRRGWTEADAREAIDDGTWTDDPHAIAYFAGVYPTSAPLGTRVRNRLRPSWRLIPRQVEHAVAEIEALAENDQGEDPR